MSQNSELQQILAEREQLKAIEAQTEKLKRAVTEAHQLVVKAENEFAETATPDGLLRFSDQQIEKLEKALRQRRREEAISQRALDEHLSGPAKGIAARLADNVERERGLKFAEARAKLVTALRAQRDRLQVAEAAEVELVKLAIAAGFSRGPITLLSEGQFGEAGPLTLWLRDGLSFDRDLLPPDHPQRKYFERMRGL